MSEIRKSILSGDWVVVAAERGRKYQKSVVKRKKRERSPIRECPFEDPQESGNSAPILMYPRNAGKGEWKLQIINNKYPVLTHHGECSESFKRGPYYVKEGVGYHDLVITRDHDDDFPALSPRDTRMVFKSFREHYCALAADPCIEYVSVFHNWGPKAGASVYHPHYQIIALPIIPPGVKRSLAGAREYSKEHKGCVHCMLIKWEKREGKRIIYENDHAIVFAPYLSRESFEVRVFPKAHAPYFESTSDEILYDVALALRWVLKKIRFKLGDPDYNFFIHSSPNKERNKYSYYHWHVGVLPKMSISAGFELGTGVEVVVVDPDDAAKLLRGR